MKLTRLSVPPGVHGPKGLSTPSQYGRQLREKQKVKRLYGVLERQFRKYVNQALKTKGNTGETLLSLLERRLDNVVYRLGFAPTRPAARQLVSHRHVLINAKKVNIPSYQVRPGETIGLTTQALGIPAIKEVLLPSLPGAAITTVKISGVKHQFSTLKGMKEDVVEFLLNLKKVRFSYSGEKPAKATLSVKVSGE